MRQNHLQKHWRESNTIWNGFYGNGWTVIIPRYFILLPWEWRPHPCLWRWEEWGQSSFCVLYIEYLTTSESYASRILTFVKVGLYAKSMISWTWPSIEKSICLMLPDIMSFRNVWSVVSWHDIRRVFPFQWTPLILILSDIKWESSEIIILLYQVSFFSLNCVILDAYSSFFSLKRVILDAY